jgi:Na+-translocating ferredoxin:NAD+ oxidoreductase RnfD subunit
LLGKILCPSIMGLLTVLIWKFGNYHLGAYYAMMICQITIFALKGFYVPKYIGEKK